LLFLSPRPIYSPLLLPPQSVDTTSMDIKIVEINSYTALILPGAQSLSDSSQNLLESYRTIAQDYGLCCGVYTSLGTVDDDYGSYAIGQMGYTFTSLTNYLNEHNSEYELTIKEPLLQSLYSVQSIQNAVHTQQQQRMSYLYAVGDMEAKQKAVEKEPGDETKKTKLRESEERAESLKQEYEGVNERLLDGYQRFKRERERDLRTIMLGLVSLQVTLHQKSDHSMNALLEEISSLHAPPRDGKEQQRDDLVVETLDEGEERNFISRQAEEV
jgi:hypothetical protein